MAKKISECRICGNKEIITVLELGVQALTGVFPKDVSDKITSGPLTLVKCHGQGSCGLLQLDRSYDLDEMYGSNYGYRSGLNPSMVAHLRSKVRRITSIVSIDPNDIVLDIGSNDGTTLKQYERDDCRLIGMDPTGSKFREYYTGNVTLVPDFFSASTFKGIFGADRAKIITSFSMFYDLEDPTRFMREIREVLHEDGIWVFEQSYMPLMLETNSYDTVCHEHLEYYAMAQIVWMAERADLEIIDVELNDINGGSFSLTAQIRGGKRPVGPSVDKLMADEARLELADLQTYADFRVRTEKSKKTLLEFLHRVKDEGKRVAALGASTKGNVVLQYCGVDSSLIYAIGEINADKFGKFAPGSNIPIVDETTILADKPDYVLVLPWHFRKFFESQERYRHLNLLYPLPELSHGSQ